MTWLGIHGGPEQLTYDRCMDRHNEGFAVKHCVTLTGLVMQ